MKIEMKEHTCKSGRKYFLKKLSWVAKKRLQFGMVKVDHSKLNQNMLPDTAAIDINLGDFYIGLVREVVLDANKNPIDVENYPFLDEDGDELFKAASEYTKIDPEELKKKSSQPSNGVEETPKTSPS